MATNNAPKVVKIFSPASPQIWAPKVTARIRVNMPKRPKKRINEPAFLDYVASQIALNRHESLDEIKFVTTENATAFFNLAKE